MAHSGRRLTIFSPHYSISIRTPRRCPARAWQRSPTRLGSQRCCVWPEAAKTIPQGGFTLQGRLHCCAACWITLSWVWGREERWRCQLLFFSPPFLLLSCSSAIICTPISHSVRHQRCACIPLVASFLLLSVLLLPPKLCRGSVFEWLPDQQLLPSAHPPASIRLDLFTFLKRC